VTTQLSDADGLTVMFSDNEPLPLQVGWVEPRPSHHCGDDGLIVSAGQPDRYWVHAAIIPGGADGFGCEGCASTISCAPGQGVITATLAMTPPHSGCAGLFGTRDSPVDRPVPQASIELDVADAATVQVAADELTDKGFTLLHEARIEP